MASENTLAQDYYNKIINIIKTMLQCVIRYGRSFDALIYPNYTEIKILEIKTWSL